MKLTVGDVGVQLMTSRGIPVQTYVYSKLETAIIKGRKLVIKMSDGNNTVLTPAGGSDAKMICKQVAYRQRQILAQQQKTSLAALQAQVRQR
eukprot:SAG22_NODE_77_length_22125_cov_46.140016_8_plen_92_part_00